MEFRQRSFAATLMVALGLLACTDHADAQSVRVGIVATMTGEATVARVSLAQPVALKFKDEVYIQDRITTDRDALVRVLLGGKAMVTIRERSVVTITEKPGVSTVNIGWGRVGVSVDRSKMLPGEVVEVTTPNAAAAIRGTVIVAEVEPALHGWRSTITVLTGVIDVTRFDGVRSSGSATALGALQQVIVQGAGPVGTPTGISRDAAQRLGGEFTVAPKSSPHATSMPAQQAVIEQSLKDVAQTVAKNSPGQGRSSPSDAGGVSQGSPQGIGVVSGGETTGGTGTAVSVGGGTGTAVSVGGGTGTAVSVGGGTGTAVSVGGGTGTAVSVGVGNPASAGGGNALGLGGGNPASAGGGNALGLGGGNAGGNGNGLALGKGKKP